jgi:hypothetical protein
MDKAKNEKVKALIVQSITRDNDQLIVNVIIDGNPQTLLFGIAIDSIMGELIADNHWPTGRTMLEHAYAIGRLSIILYDFLNNKPQPLPIELRDEPAFGNPAPNRTQ